jgi:cobalt-zinc-cadmium efflux system membrane fusion protein
MSVLFRARVPARVIPALAILFGALFPMPVAARLLPVTPQQVQRLGIRTAPVQPAAHQAGVSVLGRVTPAPDARVPVSAPFAGTVRSLVGLEGTLVRKGAVLAVIVSADMHAAQAKLRGQAAHARSAKAAADRARALVAEGIAPASRAEEAEADAAAASAELAALQSATARASGAAGGEYRLLAPVDGRVAAISVSAGDQVTAMQPVLVMDTGDGVWVEAALPASMIGRVAAGDGVKVEGGPATGVVAAAGTSIDPKTRSATVRARLTDPAGLVTGQTVRMSIFRKAQGGSFNIPRNAVVQLASGMAVFVARAGGFEVVPVQVLARGAQEATVTGRLRAGDRVAQSGVSELKVLNAAEAGPGAGKE